MQRESTAEGRARGRAGWPVRFFRLGEEPGDDLSRMSTPAERIAMMWPLTLEAWAVSGREVPILPRSAWPVRLVELPRR